MSSTQIISSQATENEEDENDIIADQDETDPFDEMGEDENMGAEGRDTPLLVQSNEFLRGELDVKDQMDRSIRASNNAAGRDPNEDILEDLAADADVDWDDDDMIDPDVSRDLSREGDASLH